MIPVLNAVFPPSFYSYLNDHIKMKKSDVIAPQSSNICQEKFHP